MFNFYDLGQGMGLSNGCSANCLQNCVYAKQWKPMQYINPMMGACNQYTTPFSNMNPYIYQNSTLMPGSNYITFITVPIDEIRD